MTATTFNQTDNILVVATENADVDRTLEAARALRTGVQQNVTLVMPVGGRGRVKINQGLRSLGYRVNDIVRSDDASPDEALGNLTRLDQTPQTVIATGEWTSEAREKLDRLIAQINASGSRCQVVSVA